jgi:diguanylate cyclase (GGDEF)-like protein/putative nucleotidyltransferase with HDIG domain
LTRDEAITTHRTEGRMQIITAQVYNRSARAYWWITTLLGALAFSYSAARILQMGAVGQVKVGLLTLLICIAGLRPIRIPGTKTWITPGDIFVYLTALFCGAEAATFVAVIDALVVSWRTSRLWTSRVGGPALMALAVLISANLFQLAIGLLLAFEVYDGTTLLGVMLGFSLLHFVLNSLLTSTFIALKKGRPPFEGWWASYRWTSLIYIASASAAGLIYLAIIKYGVTAILAAGPLVAITFATCHFYFKQAEERSRASERISSLHLATVEALATAIDAKDAITHDHVYRVQVYACGLARHFGLTKPEIEALKAGALLHDVGKIAVPDYILNKPGKLTAAEFEKMKIHTVVGAQILERVNFPYPVVPIVRHHHERWDGSGYPDGLRGNHIPMTARILTVVDCFDAVREDRQYRKGLTREQACQLLTDGAGKQFDPRVVEAFLKTLPNYEAEIAEHKAGLPLLTPTTQAGLSASALKAAPAAGLAPATEAPDYIKQISAAHTEVAALYEMSQKFAASMNTREVIALAVSRIEQMIPFTTCVVYMRQKDDDSVVAAHVFGQKADSIRNRSLGAGRGIAGWVVINGRAMSNTDPMLDLYELLGESDASYRTAAVYPLMSGDQAIGALGLYTSEMDSYNSAHLHLLESVCGLASSALERAMLYEQTGASAETDQLTGLRNARSMYEGFEKEKAEANVGGAHLAIVCFSVSGMRAVNHRYGYRAGDRVLAEVSKLLRRAIDPDSELYRIAGDEFACVVRSYGREQAVELGEQARLQLARCDIEVEADEKVHIDMSYGVAEYPIDGQGVDELLRMASIATYQSKTVIDPLERAQGIYRPRPVVVS